MDKVEHYRQVFSAFKELCAAGKQPSSFREYCREHGVSQSQMPIILKDEFQPIQTLIGYIRMHKSEISLFYAEVYEEFKKLCAEGKQPGTFKSFCEKQGVTREQMHSYLKSHNLN